MKREANVWQYYIGVPIVENDPKGAGPFMFAATEMELLERNVTRGN